MPLLYGYRCHRCPPTKILVSSFNFNTSCVVESHFYFSSTLFQYSKCCLIYSFLFYISLSLPSSSPPLVLSSIWLSEYIYLLCCLINFIFCCVSLLFAVLLLLLLLPLGFNLKVTKWCALSQHIFSREFFSFFSWNGM